MLGDRQSGRRFPVVGILYVPDDMNLVALQAVRDGKVEVVRIVLLSLFVVDEREGERSAVLPTSLNSVSRAKPWRGR